MNLSLFNNETISNFAPDAFLMHGFALPDEARIFAEIEAITRTAPLRNMVTAGGYIMSVAMTNCGKLGWVSDKKGYRYEPNDPETGKHWPDMPEVFVSLAQRAAREAGFKNFNPDACLINCYKPGTKLSLHQDKDEVDFTAPIVSVSFGLPATFLFGGLKRTDPTQKIPLQHGDVVVWGGETRMAFHGVNTLKDGSHPLFGNRRFNLTFRKAV
jgi:alkylated DNA repair protein (DNA oxidative demethylase)